MPSPIAPKRRYVGRKFTIIIICLLNCSIVYGQQIRQGRKKIEGENIIKAKGMHMWVRKMRAFSTEKIDFPLSLECTPFEIQLDSFEQYLPKEVIDKLLYTADTQMREFVMPNWQTSTLGIYFTNIVLAQSKVPNEERRLALQIKKTAVINRKSPARDVNRNLRRSGGLVTASDIEDTIESMYSDPIYMDRLIKNLRFLYPGTFDDLTRITFSHFLEPRPKLEDTNISSAIGTNKSTLLKPVVGGLTWPYLGLISGLLVALVTSLLIMQAKGVFKRRGFAGSDVERRIRKHRLDDAMNDYTAALKRYRTALNDDTPKTDSEKIHELQRKYNETMVLYQEALREWNRSGSKSSGNIFRMDNSQRDQCNSATDVCMDICESISSKSLSASNEWMDNEELPPLPSELFTKEQKENNRIEKSRGQVNRIFRREQEGGENHDHVLTKEDTHGDQLQINKYHAGANTSHNEQTRDITNYNSHSTSQPSYLQNQSFTNEMQVNELSFDDDGYESYKDDVRTVKTKDTLFKY